MTRQLVLVAASIFGFALACNTIAAEERPADAEAEAGAEADHEPSAAEAIARRIDQLRDKLDEAIRTGEREIAARLRREIQQYIERAAANKVRSIQQQAEAAVRQHIAALEEQFHRLREEGQPEFAERLAGQLIDFFQARRGTDKAATPSQNQAGPQVRHHDGAATRGEPRQIDIAPEGERDRRPTAGRSVSEFSELAAERSPHGPQADRAASSQPDSQRRLELERRLHHLLAAAENLTAVNELDQAQRLRVEAAAIQRELQAPNMSRDALRDREVDMLRHQIRDLQQQMAKLSSQVEELTRLVQQRQTP